ncbi:MAG: sensor histidine kinase [Bdellovibrio sp. CG10_big_fil_rev_8_21_14_0_10_47_8]|nr:MAG: sensor histidine kinase [Bdellovibrio sp. CG10_big_fil_rev_8_21_14_0_10_47_8]
MNKALMQSSSNWRFYLSIFWFLFTFVFIGWWWILGLESAAHHRMIFWEGLVLLPAIFSGGMALMILAARDRRRAENMKIFFSNFAHDLKTAITRVRLQAEVLVEEGSQKNVTRLMNSLQRLDLQLENSLWVARGERQALYFENIKMSQLIVSLRNEWPEVEIQLQKDCVLFADRQALISVFRNLIQNSILHGHASKIEISVFETQEGKAGSIVVLEIRDNGEGLKKDLEVSQLGHELLLASPGRGNGLGLYLVSFLMKRMKGKISFHSENGFLVRMQLPQGRGE